MRVIASYVGKNREFRAFLSGSQSGKVICFKSYQKKKAAAKAANHKIHNPSIA